MIASICRKIARDILDQGAKRDEQRVVGPEVVEDLFGPRRYSIEVVQAKERVGLATGLAWAETAGEIIFVEATRMRGRDRLILTGSLGGVMRESAQAAVSYVRSHQKNFNIPDTSLDDTDIHIHVPAGAIRKDGPSAGVTIAVALISLLTNRPCRRDIALTGELTLSGRSCPWEGSGPRSSPHRGRVSPRSSSPPETNPI